MSTAETVKAQLQADIAAANAATGKKDATMHDAVASLIEGFGGGEPVKNMISDVLSLVPMFDDTWTTAKFTLTSNHSEGIITVPNPLGAIPSVIYVLKLDIDYSIRPQVIGGYNIGNITDDNSNNRTIALRQSNTESSAPTNFINEIGPSNWNLTSATTGASTAEVINIRAGDRAGLTLWLAGEYILAVK